MAVYTRFTTAELENFLKSNNSLVMSEEKKYEYYFIHGVHVSNEHYE